MKNIAMLALFMVNGTQSANAMVCTAQMIKTACGTGKVEVTIDESEASFRMIQGDVSCWFGEYRFGGKVKAVSARHPYNLPGFQLRLVGPRDEVTDFGFLYFVSDQRNPSE